MAVPALDYAGADRYLASVPEPKGAAWSQLLSSVVVFAVQTFEQEGNTEANPISALATAITASPTAAEKLLQRLGPAGASLFAAGCFG